MSDAARPVGPRGRRSYAVEARSGAPVEEVWSLIGEAGRWKEWSFLDRTELIQPGEPDSEGVGALRRFTSHGIGSTEEVVAFEPPHHLGYTIVKGFPVRHYRADIRLHSEGTGTLISWSGTFDEKFPGTGRIMELVLGRMMGRFAAGAAGYADRQHRPAG
jgi:uncharacterized protein YndB with AHSA1/START domain